MNPMDLLKIEFGSLKDLADKLNLRPNTVYLWGQTNVPFKYLKQNENWSMINKCLPAGRQEKC